METFALGFLCRRLFFSWLTEGNKDRFAIRG